METGRREFLSIIASAVAAGNLRAISLKPNQVFVLKLDRLVSMHNHEHIMNTWKVIWQNGDETVPFPRLLVLGPGMELSVAEAPAVEEVSFGF
jgi:hypothetical protein